MKHLILCSILIACMATLVAQKQDWLTIYNDDLSLVRSQFDLELKEGRQPVNYDMITSRIDNASVIVKSLKDSVVIAEQNYEYDLAGTEQILAKYLDCKVTADIENATYTGVMKFYDGQSIGIIEDSSGKLFLISRSEIQLLKLAELPKNFYIRPTLHWELIAPKKGKFPLQISYLTGGLSWNVTYNSVWDGKYLKLNAWVTITNNSGRGFENTTLKLIAGEINQIRQRYYEDYDGRAMLSGAGMAMEKSAPSFEEKAFHDFHMYTLDQPVSFADKQTKQIQMFELKNVKAEAVYNYQTYADKIESRIKFKNIKENGLGIPLPKGIVKFYKQDSDNNIEFIGEDQIDHTSKNEDVSLKTGNAFDLVGSTREIGSEPYGKNGRKTTIKVTLRNNSTEEKTIEVRHNFTPSAKIIKVDRAFTIEKDRTALWTVQIKPDEEVVFTFIQQIEY